MANEVELLKDDRPVRVAVIGAGGVAQVFHLPLLSSMEEVKLVGLCDLEEYKLGSLSQKYDVPGFVDVENLLRRTHPDVVLVCTPTLTHLPISLTALQAGVHVIVEKPVTRSLEETERLAEAAKKSRRLVFVNMKHRFRQDVTVLKNFLREGELGKIWRVRAGWLKKRSAWARSPWLDKKRISGGGVLMDLGVEMIDLIHWILGTPKIARVNGFTHRDTLKREVEDTATSTIVYENGITFHLDCSWGLYSEKDVAYTFIEGDAGSAKLNPLMVWKTIQDELVNVSPVRTTNPRELYMASFEAQLYHFIRALRGQELPISTVEEARKTIRIIDLIYRSAALGKEIAVDDR